MSARRDTDELNARDVRRQILDAGRQLFATRGYHGVTVAELIEASAVSRATFYFYFENKDAVFTPLIREHITEMARFCRPSPATVDPYHRIVEGHARNFWFSSPERIGRIFRDARAMSQMRDDYRDFLSAQSAALQALLERKLEREMRAGDRPRGDVRLIGLAIRALTTSFMIQFHHPELSAIPLEEASLHDAIQVLSDAWFSMIYAKAPTVPYPREWVQQLLDTGFGTLDRAGELVSASGGR